jgi:hypothetical protein
MLFFLNLDGTVTRSDTDHVYQGQNKVANVELFTLTPAQAAIQVAFTLPNGLTTAYLPMSYVGAYSVDESNQKQVHHWKLAMPYDVTEVEGQVGVSFNVVFRVVKDETSGQTLETINQTTYTSSFTVEYSALPIPPTTVNNDEIQQILDLLDKYYAQNKDLINKQVFVVGTVTTNTLDANQQASVAVEQSAVADGNGNYPTNFTFSIPQGIQGTQGEVGETPDVSAVAEVNNTVGTPSVEVEKSGTKENLVFNFKFSNIKGQKGDSGIGNANLSNTPGTSETDGYTQNAVNGIVQNPNLLINPNFAINQRGQVSYTGAVYGVDRWKGIGSAITATPVTNGIQLSSSGASNIYIKQIVETNLAGKTVTASCKLSAINGGEGGRFAVYYSTDGSSWTFISGMTITAAGISKLTVTIPSNAVYVSVDTGVRPSSDVVFEWAKLEIGSVATEFSTPNIAEELQKCYRYYKKITNLQQQAYTGLGIVYGDGSGARMIVENTFRANPTITTTGAFAVVANDATHTVSAISMVSFTSTNIVVKFTLNSAVANGLCGYLLSNNSASAYIAFDAEL